MIIDIFNIVNVETCGIMIYFAAWILKEVWTCGMCDYVGTCPQNLQIPIPNLLGSFLLWLFGLAAFGGAR